MLSMNALSRFNAVLLPSSIDIGCSQAEILYTIVHIYHFFFGISITNINNNNKTSTFHIKLGYKAYSLGKCKSYLSSHHWINRISFSHFKVEINLNCPMNKSKTCWGVFALNWQIVINWLMKISLLQQILQKLTIVLILSELQFIYLSCSVHNVMKLWCFKIAITRHNEFIG